MSGKIVFEAIWMVPRLRFAGMPERGQHIVERGTPPTVHGGTSQHERKVSQVCHQLVDFGKRCTHLRRRYKLLHIECAK